MISVPGGGHWGGGIVISARDLALMGLLVAQGGAWNGKQLLPKGWTEELVKPCPVAPFYGLMWWLNTDRRQFAAASEKSYFALRLGQPHRLDRSRQRSRHGAALDRPQAGAVVSSNVCWVRSSK